MSTAGFLDSIEDVFTALLVAGAIVSVRRGALSIKMPPGRSIPRAVGQAASRSKMALTVHAARQCDRCGGDQATEHGRGYVLASCRACEFTRLRRRDSGRPMGFFVEYADNSPCKTCPRVGETHGGWCLWCLAKREGVDWDVRLAEIGPERVETARESSEQLQTQPRGSSELAHTGEPAQSSLFR